MRRCHDTLSGGVGASLFKSMYVTQDRTIENMVSLLVYHRVYVDAHSDGPEGKKKKKKNQNNRWDVMAMHLTMYVCINASHVNLTCPGCYCPWALGVVNSRGLLGCWHQLRRWHWLTKVIWKSSQSGRWVCWQLNEQALQQEWLQVASAMKWRWGAIRDREITGSKRSRGREKRRGLQVQIPWVHLHAGHILTASVQILDHYYLLPQFILAGNHLS